MKLMAYWVLLVLAGEGLQGYWWELVPWLPGATPIFLENSRDRSQIIPVGKQLLTPASTEFTLSY